MNVLSLFDGMSCGMLALQRAGIKVDKYFASEIDKYAIQVSQKNFPEINHIGDVTKVRGLGDNLYCGPSSFNQNTHGIDLLIGGSPCQGFSFAGKQLNFEDPRSKLFFEYVRILKEVEPKYFLFENVRMKKEYQDIISENLFGVQPIEINSSLVSAQNRRRLYRVGERQEDGSYKQVHIDQPKDKGILLKDILEENKKYDIVKGLAIRGRYNSEGKVKQNIEIGTDKANAITSVQKDSMIYQVPRGYNKGGLHKNKSPTISSYAWQYNNFVTDGIRIRKLTPVECERLQTVSDNYTEGVSNSQRYKMLGNGRTVDVIAYIFTYLKT